MSWAQASPQIQIGAEVDFFYEANNAPSSKKGETAFEFSRLELIPQFILKPELSLEMRFDLAEERDASSGYQSKMENAFFNWSPPKSPQTTHHLGLIRPFWRTEEGWTASLDNFGDSSKNLVRRFNYLADGDLGYQGIWRWNSELSGVLGVINGEENKTAEIGPSKEVFFGLFQRHEDTRSAIWLSYGRVDNVDDRVSEKSRVFLRLQKPYGRVRMGFEGLIAQDSSSDMENQKRAEGITFTELTELRNISSQAGRVEIYYQLSPSEVVLLRYDRLDTEIAKKTVESTEVAWVKSEPELLDWGVYYENTLYGSEHSAQSRQVERVRLGISKTF